MAWNDERVELLKKLWAEGLSASQIAGRLGGVTRNAVIGKVHRLGLSGRATTSRMKSHRPRARAATARRLAAKPAAGRPFRTDRQSCRPRAVSARSRAFRSHRGGTRHSAQGAPHHSDADRVQLPLADRRPANGGLPFLRQAEGHRSALLRISRTSRFPAAADAPARSRDARHPGTGSRHGDGFRQGAGRRLSF